MNAPSPLSRFFSAPASSLLAQQTPQQLADAELPVAPHDLQGSACASGDCPVTKRSLRRFVAKELKAVGCDVTEKVGKYEKPSLQRFGVVGVMKNGDGPAVLVRTDLDATAR